MTNRTMHKQGEKSWAPCFHDGSPEENQAQRDAYILRILGADWTGTSTETLLWAIGLGWYSGCLGRDVEAVGSR